MLNKVVTMGGHVLFEACDLCGHVAPGIGEGGTSHMTAAESHWRVSLAGAPRLLDVVLSLHQSPLCAWPRCTHRDNLFSRINVYILHE